MCMCAAVYFDLTFRKEAISIASSYKARRRSGFGQNGEDDFVASVYLWCWTSAYNFCIRYYKLNTEQWDKYGAV